MKRNIFFVLVVFAALFGCKKDQLLTYGTRDNIYLNYKDKDGNQDTSVLTYSFAYNPTLAQDTIWVPVIISGQRSKTERRFAISVVDTATTAKAGLHYEALKPSYTMPADSGTVKVPVIIKNTDPELANKSVVLTILVSGGQDFNSSLPVALRMRSILYSSRLEQPAWWIYWMGNLGPYSRIKHQLFLISSGTTDLVDMSKPNAYLQIPRTLYYIDNVRTFINDPFAWVARYPEKGYILTKRADGSNDYDFYSSSSPGKKFYLKYYAQAGKYFFVDENGQQVIIN
ncbi:DUF4843 domain-containing protein [Mucilaginibacter sp. NFR10]|jgi:hypothetical protein|uniref:DUF4843 domain-containing protein n=1 Tax=Mucilaginibacter sp. NFR10 TaxID=1566292 RepID=UPI00087161AB|nr:DUF4843 domain-containing protein [Mucilaginibacter sp. NFR10]SCW50463.1 protein of unknown function [Mucilaginibacter sp. NFR10]